jgi:hypothetical protein
MQRNDRKRSLYSLKGNVNDVQQKPLDHKGFKVAGPDY